MYIPVLNYAVYLSPLHLLTGIKLSWCIKADIYVPNSTRIRYILRLLFWKSNRDRALILRKVK